MSAVNEIIVKVDWDKPLETVDGCKLLHNHVVEVATGEIYILTFAGITNPIVYNNGGVCLGQLNYGYICSKLYPAYEIRNCK